VLVHGGGAHAGWWDHIAPLLSVGRRIVAPDLSGHGESTRRSGYSFDCWAREVIAVADAEGAMKPAVFGHSMGGCVSLIAAHLLGDRIGGLGVIDSLVAEISPEVRAWTMAGGQRSEHRIHAHRDEAVARFRALPADPTTIEYIRRHVAIESLRQVGGGWQWKFDPNVYSYARFEPGQVRSVECEVALVAGERGLSSPDVHESISSGTGRRVPRIVIPDAGHHLLLEQPTALVAVMRTLMATWGTGESLG
jgi:pimeloyl-ACP methyl ester carboxylesterase